MFDELSPELLVSRIKQSFDGFCDVRKGQNTQFDMVDAGMGAFSVFFTQSPSFLAHQQDMKRRKGRCNAESLFGMDQIPSDNQIRLLLDPVAPAYVSAVFRDIYQRLDRAGVLKDFRSHAHSLLVAIDGTQYFSSQKIHCENCSCRELNKGKTNYFHSVLTSVIVQPGNERVITLEPEYITPQDGKDKQDCEIEGYSYNLRGITQRRVRYGKMATLTLKHQGYRHLHEERPAHFASSPAYRLRTILSAAPKVAHQTVIWQENNPRIQASRDETQKRQGLPPLPERKSAPRTGRDSMSASSASVERNEGQGWPQKDHPNRRLCLPAQGMCLFWHHRCKHSRSRW